jgi:hypothetical protein
MKDLITHLSVLELARVILTAIAIGLFIWKKAYAAGIRKAERQFCDKFVRED